MHQSRCWDSYYDGLSDLSLDHRTEDAQMLVDLSADLRYGEATVHISSENYFVEACFLAVYL